jgi:hypothetical protein
MKKEIPLYVRNDCGGVAGIGGGGSRNGFAVFAPSLSVVSSVISTEGRNLNDSLGSALENKCFVSIYTKIRTLQNFVIGSPDK